jgi:acetyl-CoA/propionyl-CoA carboxylase biotin carboxyl carrier protein
VTGLDLVHLQIEQALKTDSFLLPKQESIFPRGHSIEVRIYAEDPAQGFMPTPGPVWRVKWPTGAGIRVESGIEEGQVLGTKFDPMIGKLITRAETRLKAIERMKFALEETVILGLGTNQSYLHALTQDDQVREGRVHTHFLEEAYASFKPPLPDLTPILQVSEKSIRVPAPWSGSFL